MKELINNALAVVLAVVFALVVFTAFGAGLASLINGIDMFLKWNWSSWDWAFLRLGTVIGFVVGCLVVVIAIIKGD